MGLIKKAMVAGGAYFVWKQYEDHKHREQAQVAAQGYNNRDMEYAPPRYSPERAREYDGQRQVEYQDDGFNRQPRHQDNAFGSVSKALISSAMGAMESGSVGKRLG